MNEFELEIGMKVKVNGRVGEVIWWGSDGVCVEFGRYAAMFDSGELMPFKAPRSPSNARKYKKRLETLL